MATTIKKKILITLKGLLIILIVNNKYKNV